MGEDAEEFKKPHRARSAGKKAQKKKEKGQDKKSLKHDPTTAKERNPKAFSFQSSVSAERQFRRTQDLDTKKQHAPLIDRTPLEPPPIVVAIVGPPKVGKSTLAKCLIKNFTKQNVTSIKGPVTLVSGKKRRLTIIECNNDINSMIDIAKIADLVLLLVDAWFGFEMETFEFLNICQVHGFPRIMGVLTHLDYFKQNKQLRKTKKTLKHRFWTEVYAGAKLFYLSGMVHGEYQRMEVKNLGRFISVMKFRPISWRNQHPYVLADRMEDNTEVELIRKNPKCDRNVCFYGYLRGIHLKPDMGVHIPGVGDFIMDDVSKLPDPCGLPNTGDKKMKRSLNEREKLVYAPMSGMTGVVYDKDAVYVDLKKSGNAEATHSEAKSLVETMQGQKETLDTKLEEATMRIFSSDVPLLSNEVQYEEEDSSPSSGICEEIIAADDGRRRRKVIFNDEDTNGVAEAEESDDEGELGGLFRVSKPGKLKLPKSGPWDEIDCSVYTPAGTKDVVSRDWSNEEVRESIKDCFVTGQWKSHEDARSLLKMDDDEEVFGDFEDLQTGEVVKAEDEGMRVVEDKPEMEKTAAEKRLEKKRKLKEMFDAEYDDKDPAGTYFDDLKKQMEMQAQMNRAEFEGMDENLRLQFEGYRPGLYIRIELKGVPCEFVEHFDPTYPVVIGGLISGEENTGYVRVRIKKHRWHKKILKSRDPLIISLGWRRFQTMPIFSAQDVGLRNRMLKYTPEHVHCYAHFWGPVTPQNQGFLAFQSLEGRQAHFRIAATGAVMDLDKTAAVVKKLKLVGTPLKVYKKTAFIRGMFTTCLEAAKFEGAAIKSVSGIRDIVFVRTWYEVTVPKFYAPLQTLCLAPSERTKWQGMRTVREIKRERGIKAEPNPDNLYTPIERTLKQLPRWTIPKSLQRQVPYKDKPKYAPSNPGIPVEKKRIAVIREPEEEKANELIRSLKMMRREKQFTEKEKAKTKRREYRKQLQKAEVKQIQRVKNLKKRIFKEVSRMNKKPT
ncbi:unnamed protein product [Notodromas monacha]|uniref:Bms1-type G domain-containing protein n=1 Tax=Notodromas monacha TaxID=399045 RepID=A0A7R9BNV9_9CRUS|nr:unnamed protein product [Notodromas monacha]CAG0917440.1 unnamed protein product [Notodromas monacha]